MLAVVKVGPGSDNVRLESVPEPKAKTGMARVRVLATAIHRAEEQGTRIVLCRFSGPAADCLLVSGFSQLFDVAGSVEEARKRLHPSPADRLHRRGTTG